MLEQIRRITTQLTPEEKQKFQHRLSTILVKQLQVEPDASMTSNTIMSRELRRLLLEWITQYETQPNQFTILMQHCADEDEAVRTFCINTTTQHGFSELRNQIGEEGIVTICSNLSRAPFESTCSCAITFLIHVIRLEMEDRMKERGLSILTVPLDTMLDLISESIYLAS